MAGEREALEAFAPEVTVAAMDVEKASRALGMTLVVLDDDPTGTQSVSDLPVLTRWQVSDFEWAFGADFSGSPASAVYVLTNTRSLAPEEAAARNREIVTNAIAAAGDLRIAFVSRGDSTLRGHFPLEPDVIAETLLAETGQTVDGVVIVPAFPDAGRITIGGIHYMRGEAGTLTPVGETEFARDTTFGYSSSSLAEWVEEKTAGAIQAADVAQLTLDTIRGGTSAIADVLSAAHDRAVIVADAVTENDLRALALGVIEAEGRGTVLVYRVGPPFVRARIGQEERAPLTADDALGDSTVSTGGLIVVGSHVALTTRQLDRLTAGHPAASVVELDVNRVLDPETAGGYLAGVIDGIASSLESTDVVVHTSRLLVTTDDAFSSLAVSRAVSSAVVDVVRGVLAARTPRFVIAKGGITSSDVASEGLQIRHAIVRGPLMPGIISLWEPVDGPAAGIPYVVFAGNVGDDDSLLAVVAKLSAYVS